MVGERRAGLGVVLGKWNTLEYGGMYTKIGKLNKN
jgi:hypothetical protein